MAITQVRTPSGAIVKVQHPDGASPDEILQYAQQNYKPSGEAMVAPATRVEPQPLKQPQAGVSSSAPLTTAPPTAETVTSRPEMQGPVGSAQPQDAVKQRQQQELAADIGEIGSARAQGIISPAVVPIAQTGEWAQYAGQRFGERVVNPILGLAGKLPSFGGGTIGDRIPSELAGIGSAVAGAQIPLTDTTVGQVGASAAQKASDFDSWLKESHPNIYYATRGAVKTGAAATAVVPAARGAITGSKLVGEGLLGAADKQKFNKIQELVNPLKPSGKTSGKALEYGQKIEPKGKGIFTQHKYTPDSLDKEIADTVYKKVPEVSNLHTFVEKQKVLQDYNNTHAAALDEAIKARDVPIAPKRLEIALDDAIKQLGNQYRLKGDPLDYVDGIRGKALEIFNGSGDFTTSGLLQARKDLDAWMTDYNSVKLTPDNRTSLGAAALKLRRAMNDVIAENVPDVDVKQALKDEHNIYSAIDRVTPKVLSEGSSLWNRVWNKVDQGTAIKAGVASAVGIGGAAAAGVAGTVLPITLGAGGLYVGKRLLSSEATKRVIGHVLTLGTKLGKQERGLLDFVQKQADSRQLLLAPKEKMSRLPMTEGEVVRAQAKMRSGEKRPDKPIISGASIKQAPTPDQVPPKMLPAPSKEVEVTPKGEARFATAEQKFANEAARQREFELGSSPSVRANIFRNEMKARFASQWGSIDRDSQIQILKQVEKLWQEKKLPLGELIDRARAGIQYTNEATGSGPTAIYEAMKRAKK